MAIKSILCIFGGAPEELQALNVAFELAKLHEACVKFLHISRHLPYVQHDDRVVYADIIERLEKENEVRLDLAKKYVADYALKYNVVLGDSDVPAHHASARFLHVSGVIGDLVAQEGRVSDLLIISRGISPADMSYEATVLAALYDTGRPLLLVPVIPASDAIPWRDKTIMLAWNGSLEAARATYHAMPYLQRAEKLYVIQVHEHRQTANVTSLLALTDYLRAHGIHITDALSVTSEHKAVSSVLMNQAKELGADLLIMGAYGHGRYREMLLGGVTKEMLDMASFPLFLSH